MKRHRRQPLNYAHLLRWFRDAWHAEMETPHSRIHVRDIDDGGAPEWHQRFESLMDQPVAGVVGHAEESFPLRFHLRNMANASTRGRRRAEFLFRLACLDFDLFAAARASSDLAAHADAEDWLRDYAEVSLWRLYSRAHDIRHNDLEGKPRRYLPREEVRLTR